MPYYEYFCPSNDAVVEVRHGMAEALETWGEVCARADRPPGDTPADAPVERLMSLPVPSPSAAPRAESCGPGCACAMEA